MEVCCPMPRPFTPVTKVGVVKWDMALDDGIIDFVLNTGNVGVAVDFGAVYNISDYFTLSAS